MVSAGSLDHLGEQDEITLHTGSDLGARGGLDAGVQGVRREKVDVEAEEAGEFVGEMLDLPPEFASRAEGCRGCRCRDWQCRGRGIRRFSAR